MGEKADGVMQQVWWRSRVAAVARALSVLIPVLVSGQTTRTLPQTVDQLAERASSGAWDSFTARVTVRREMVDASGARG